ncbi:MAG: TIM barrel protein [Candidatus Aenigmarchaeota archaeon]|nr:TIM barrel protein [Candidatus Aenigmarchaeota archaeon]
MALLGKFVSKNTNIIKSFNAEIALAEKYGVKMKSAQIFLVGPRDSHQIYTANELINLGEYLREKNIYTIVHGAYIDHLFSEKPLASAKAKINIEIELEMSSQLGAHGLNIHLACVNPDFIIEKLDAIGDKIIQCGVKVYLEINSCKQNAWSFEKTANINELFRKIKGKKYEKFIGLCIDTAHLWSCGLDISSAKYVDEWLDSLRVKDIIFHLNDNVNPRGTGRDIHEVLGQGMIWKHDKSGLISFMDYANARKLIVILERSFTQIVGDYLILEEIYDKKIE